ncbi:hypothetical protein X975_09482, partial [Stegodyphus mimosarum]
MFKLLAILESFREPIRTLKIYICLDTFTSISMTHHSDTIFLYFLLFCSSHTHWKLFSLHTSSTLQLKIPHITYFIMRKKCNQR